MKIDKLLTKRKYMHGLQCPKYLWVTFGSPKLIPEPDIVAGYRINERKLVGELVQQLYPGGIEVPIEDFASHIEQTRAFIKQRKLIFGAGILVDNIYSQIDILKPVDNDLWDIIDIKNATDIKSHYIAEISFQKFCCERAGLKIRKCCIAYINNGYVRQGGLDPHGMFKIEDITANVNIDTENIQKEIEEMVKIIHEKECPKITISQHCKDPDECLLKGHCWEFLPINNVFELTRGGKKSFELFARGICEIKDIPDGFKLTEKQLIQKKCVLTNSVHISKEDIKNFINSLLYPLYYLDFESYMTAIPRFDGTKPYQQIPFQFSIHIVKDKDGEIEHRSFLADGIDDPRKKLVTSLISVLGDKGSVVVYSSFEKTRLRELAEAFPEHKAEIDSIVGRIVDLFAPFQDFQYYNSEQKGSASIKAVLPAITGKGYKDMEISDGQVASISYLNVTFGKVSDEEKAKTRKELEKYCCLDTKGMVWIGEKLKELIAA
ncbi:MAG: DUF2779 domain-containing protein [Candidatus Omnitrophica bacterium]|nr:DUF2779 domain-containing protein [Candidatus Omnitrophota bacterium]